MPSRLDAVVDHRRKHDQKPWAPAEALVWFYEATHDPVVLELASRVAGHHFDNSTHADGSFNPTSKADHTHSYLGTLRGLLLFGELTHNQAYIDRVNATLHNYVLKDILTPAGFMAHDLDTGGSAETTSPGDVAQLAVWLADRHGQLTSGMWRNISCAPGSSPARSPQPLP